jgi:hypothetical protein
LLGESLTIRDVNDLKTDLLGCAGKAADLELVVPDDAAVDLSFVQLIVAARAQALRLGHNIRLARPAAGEFRRVLERAGFLSPAAPDSLRFWLHEEQAR